MVSPLPTRSGRRAALPQSNPPCPRAIVLHGALPGRLRIHLPGWQPAEPVTLERRLRMVPGVRTVRATPETGNILFTFDPTITTVERLLSAAESATGQGTIGQGTIGQGTTPAGSAPGRRAAPLARRLVVHLPALLGLVLSLLACTTPLGYARLGLEAFTLAIRIGTAGA